MSDRNLLMVGYPQMAMLDVGNYRPADMQSFPPAAAAQQADGGRPNAWRYRMQARALAGMDPTDEQADLYNAGIPERGERTFRMGKLGPVALPAANAAKAFVGGGGMAWLTRLGVLGLGSDAANAWPFPDQPYAIQRSDEPQNMLMRGY